jgi:hypothetical protein
MSNELNQVSNSVLLCRQNTAKGGKPKYEDSIV